ncbi:hypothetical protein CKA32_003030 [Geitlerinema sp. FC II]|nr:hypothetical protein CKA32_003030 [Geitlerinema sp. FC II]
MWHLQPVLEPAMAIRQKNTLLYRRAIRRVRALTLGRSLD